jgi:2-polyprenyl-3-methyl-5-hydroxy-6-metoxy-1,4-benzoquinol methylase
MEENLKVHLTEESIFFNDLIRKRLSSNRIPIEADYRRATKYIPKTNENQNELIDPHLYLIVQGEYINELIMRIAKQTGNALDICCGPGWLSLELARNGIKVDAYDISDLAIATAKKMLLENPYPLNNGGVNYNCQDVNKINFNTKQYNTIYGFSAFHHVYDFDIFMNNCLNNLPKGGLMVTFDDIGYTKTDTFFKNLFLFILPTFDMSYIQKFKRLYNYFVNKKALSNEIYSPMEVYASKHDIASDSILDFFTKKMNVEKIIYFGAFSVRVCNSISGPDWFRYGLAKFLTILDRLLIKIGICRGYYRIIYSTK